VFRVVVSAVSVALPAFAAERRAAAPRDAVPLLLGAAADRHFDLNLATGRFKCDSACVSC